MIKLYSYWRSTAAYRVRLALNIKQISYLQESVHLTKKGGEQNQPAYQSLNPQGLVPTLVDDGLTIGQSLAILDYLEEKYPQRPLLPKDRATRALARQLSQMIACDLHPLNNLRVLNYLSDELVVDDASKIQWYHHWLKLGFDAFEQLLLAHSQSQGATTETYCLGGELSIADVCLIPQIYNAERLDFCLDAYPRLQKINQNCLKLVAFQDGLPKNQPDAV